MGDTDEATTNLILRYLKDEHRCRHEAELKEEEWTTTEATA